MRESLGALSDQRQPLPKFWRLSRTFHRVRYSAGKVLRAIVDSDTVSQALPLISGAYLAALDLWKDDWELFSAHESLHRFLFWIAILLPFSILFLKSFVKKPKRFESPQATNEILIDFIKSIAAIVSEKADRFRNATPNIRPKADKFAHITKPEDQIPFICRIMVNFVCTQYDLKPDQIDVSILQEMQPEQWEYYYCHHPNWNRLPAADLMHNSSAAQACLESGEIEFHPDKVKSASKHEYVLTKRDRNRGDGSAFVYPVNVRLSDREVRSVICVITYGRQLCHEHEKNDSEFTKKILTEFCNRIELELRLDAIKNWIK